MQVIFLVRDTLQLDSNNDEIEATAIQAAKRAKEFLQATTSSQKASFLNAIPPPPLPTDEEDEGDREQTDTGEVHESDGHQEYDPEKVAPIASESEDTEEDMFCSKIINMRNGSQSIL